MTDTPKNFEREAKGADVGEIREKLTRGVKAGGTSPSRRADDKRSAGEQARKPNTPARKRH